MTRSRAQAGFTLVEVMIVLAIIGIMAAIGIPSFKGLVPRIRLNNNTMVLANEISLARVRAISKSTDFSIVFHPDTERYTLKKYDPAEKNMGDTLLSGSDLYKTGRFSPTYAAGRFVPPTWDDPPTPLSPADTLNFSGNGQVSNVPLNEQAVIELCTKNAGRDVRKRIFVEPTGRVHVWRWMGGAWKEN